MLRSFVPFTPFTHPSTFDENDAELATITYLAQHGPTEYTLLRNSLYYAQDYTRYHELIVRLIVHRVVIKVGDYVHLTNTQTPSTLTVSSTATEQENT